MKFLSTLGQYAHALAASLVLQAMAWGLRIFVATTREEILTEEQRLARELARWVGLPESAVAVRFIVCPDGSVVPKVELKSDVTDKDRATILYALDRAFAVRQNCRTASDGRFH